MIFNWRMIDVVVHSGGDFINSVIVLAGKVDLYKSAQIGPVRVSQLRIGVNRVAVTDPSLERQKLLKARISKASKKRLIKVLSPFYDPAKMVPSPGMAELLARFA